MSTRSDLTSLSIPIISIVAPSPQLDSPSPKAFEVPPISKCYQKFIEIYFGLEIKEAPALPMIPMDLHSDQAAASSDTLSYADFVEAIPTDLSWKMLVPIRALLTDFVKHLLPFIHESCPKTYELLTDKKNASSLDALQKLFSALREFDKNNNPKQLISYVTICRNVLFSIKKPKDPDLVTALINNLENIIQMLYPENSHLIRKSVPELFGELALNFPGFRFQVAVNSYVYLAEALNDVFSLFQQNYEECTRKINEANYHSILPEFSEAATLVKKEFFEGTPDFPRAYKIDIYRIYRELKKELKEHNQGLLYNLVKILASEYSLQNQRIICKGSKNTNARYVREHSETYRNFLPLVKEHQEYLLERCSSLAETCEILNNFHLYIKFGNLEQLRKRLSESSHSHCNFRIIFIDEILKFSKQYKTDPALLKQAISFFKSKEAEPLKKHRELVNILQRFYSQTQYNIKELLSEPLQLAESYSKDLFPVIYPNNLKNWFLVRAKAPAVRSIAKRSVLMQYEPLCDRRTPGLWRRRKTSFSSCLGIPTPFPPPAALKKPQAKDLSEASALHEKSKSPALEDIDLKTPALSPVVTAPALVPREIMPEPLPILLARAHEHSYSFIGQLYPGSQGFETIPALHNAQMHLSALIGAVNRFSCKTQRPVKRTEIFSLVADCVHHCNLTVEQMLSALGRESNRLSSYDELKPHLSHNLAELLFNCKFIKADLPPHIRQWIHQINGGELCARKVALCPMNGNAAQRLLVKAGLFSTGSDAFGLADIAADLQSYTSSLGAFCASFSEPFQLAKREKCLVDIKKAQAIKSSLTAISRQLAAKVRSVEIDDAPFIPIIEPGALAITAQIRSLLADLLTSAPSEWIKASLHNILSNLLVRLESELQTHDKLQPSELALHYSNVLLLRQLIAEQFLQNLIDAQAIDTEEEICPHDLLAMVKALGLNEGLFSKEELNFLSRGRETLELSRYPASYFSRHPTSLENMKEHEKVFKAMSKIPQDLSHVEPHERGFAYSGKIGKVIAAVKDSVYKDLMIFLSVQKKILENLKI